MWTPAGPPVTWSWARMGRCPDTAIKSGRRLEIVRDSALRRGVRRIVPPFSSRRRNYPVTRRQRTRSSVYFFCTCTQLFRRFTRFQTSNSFAFCPGISSQRYVQILSSAPFTKAFKQNALSDRVFWRSIRTCQSAVACARAQRLTVCRRHSPDCDFFGKPRNIRRNRNCRDHRRRTTIAVTT